MGWVGIVSSCSFWGWFFSCVLSNCFVRRFHFSACLKIRVCCGGHLLCPAVVWGNTQLFKVVTHQQKLIFNSMFVLVVLYCPQVFSWCDSIHNHIRLAFLPLKLLSFTFLVQLFCNSHKWSISQDIGCILKTRIEKEQPNIFSSG